jgi:hypothetical protein
MDDLDVEYNSHWPNSLSLRKPLELGMELQSSRGNTSSLNANNLKKTLEINLSEILGAVSDSFQGSSSSWDFRMIKAVY